MSKRLGRGAFWLYNADLVLWIVFNFFPNGWPELDAAYDHGLAYPRSQACYDTTIFWHGCACQVMSSSRSARC